jgi:outer membrane protein assembly factor BamB
MTLQPIRIAFATLILGAFCSCIADEPLALEWPEFRGPNGNGVSEVKDLPILWSEPFRRPVWSTSIPGQGWSSPIVLGDKIWLSSAEVIAVTDSQTQAKLDANEYGPDDFQTHGSVVLLAIELDANTGEATRSIELGRVENPTPIHSMNSYASPTPCTDGKRVVMHFGSLGTFCIDGTTGKTAWQCRYDLDDITGPATSLVMNGGLVYLACDATSDQFLCAIDVQTGTERWRTQRPPIDTARGAERRAFSTPLIVEHAGTKQLLAPCAQWLVSYDPISGHENWRCRIGKGHALVPRVVYENGIAFVCSGYMRPELFAVRVDGRGDVTDSHVAWTWKKQVPEVASPVLVHGTICFVSSFGVATCLDQKEGHLLWQQRLSGAYSASPTVANGLIYFSNQHGLTTVGKSSQTGFETIASNELFGETLASMAIYRDGFLIRTHPVLHYIRKSALDR